MTQLIRGDFVLNETRDNEMGFDKIRVKPEIVSLYDSEFMIG